MAIIKLMSEDSFGLFLYVSLTSDNVSCKHISPMSSRQAALHLSLQLSCAISLVFKIIKITISVQEI